METIHINKEDHEDYPVIAYLANGMPTSESRRRAEAWVEKHHNADGSPLVLITYDRRDDVEPGFKMICSEIDKTFVF